MSSNRKMYFFFCSKPIQTNRIKKKTKIVFNDEDITVTVQPLVVVTYKGR